MAGVKATRRSSNVAAGCEAESSASVYAELQSRVNAGTITPADIDDGVARVKALRAQEKAQDARAVRAAAQGARAARQRVARREARARRRIAAPRRRAPRPIASARPMPAESQAQDAGAGGPAPPAPEDAPSDPDEDDADGRTVGGAAVGAEAHPESPDRTIGRALLHDPRVRHPHPIRDRAAGLPARRPHGRARRGAARVHATTTAREEAPA